MTAGETELLEKISKKVDAIRLWQTKQEVVCHNARHKLAQVASDVWGTDTKDGLNILVDRLTIGQKAMGKLLWLSVGTALGLAMTIVGHWIG